MAIKYSCDRCGAEIENRESITRLRIVRPTQRPDTTLYDLCPKCDGELVSFLVLLPPKPNWM